MLFPPSGCCCYSPLPSLPPRGRVPPVVGRDIFSSSPSPSSRRRYPAATCGCSSAAVSTFSRALGRGGRHRPVFNPFVRMEQLWARGSMDKNKGLVEHLEQYGMIKSTKVAETMEAIDRRLFVPGESAAYVDSPMPIGYNATISAPHMHATCLELLKDHLQPGMRALDVGSGVVNLSPLGSFYLVPMLRAIGGTR